uniref:Uncharacterized protein n=1 Tax=Candidatus Kentrum sp. TUN TaxID=2126343 RepID=A0A451AUN3_9GAMM|nr:MAG: hypothetical protein BECKTUN1418F_GA0071002_12105 [Candidatus Kentron sp. TUN]VFK69743.1 MAG: hypothetical protein BECKTUN1418E_GA0071001_12104 [Candidatus Kentron sp. TUN]
MAEIGGGVDLGLPHRRMLVSEANRIPVSKANRIDRRFIDAVRFLPASYAKPASQIRNKQINPVRSLFFISGE